MTAAEIARALAASLGGGVDKTGGQYFVRCPCHAERTGSLAIRDGDLGPILYCHAGCAGADVIAALRERGLWNDRDPRSAPPRRSPPPQAKQHTDAARIGYARDIWNAAVDPRGTLGEKYLNGRGLELDDDLRMRVLRFHSRCPFGKNETTKERIIVPALIAAFRPIRNDDEDKPPQGIHRIGLNRDGTKISRKMLGPVTGCAIKLDPDDMVEEGLGICEGIEDAIGVRRDGWHPVWATGSASRIKTLEPIPGIETLTIFADHDDTGLRDARECAERWVDAGLEAFIKYRPEPGKDFADA